MSKLKDIAERLSVLAIKHCDRYHHDFSEIVGMCNQLGDMDESYEETVSQDIGPPPMKLHTETIPGNLHESAIIINKSGWAEYLVSMTSDSGHYTIAVFRMPYNMVNAIRSESRSYAANPSHDDPEVL